MPSDNVDRVLNAIDAGLQADIRGELVATTAPKAATCWRCHQTKTTRPTGLCEDCRAWCAGESDEDPAHRVHDRVEVSNLMGDVPETRPTIAGLPRASERLVGAFGGMWGRLFVPVAEQAPDA